MKNFKKMVFILIIIMLIFTIYIFTSVEDEKKSLKPIVSVTTFPLYDITKHIAQDSIKLVNILPFGVDPHSFEPTPRLMAKIEKSFLVIYSGVGLEPWTHGIDFKNRVIDMSKHVNLRELSPDGLKEYDPHYWLDFDNMQKATLVIRDELIRLNPKYEKVYLQNSVKYILMLKSLDNKYKKHLLFCSRDTVILNHNSIGYLASKYNFYVQSLSGLSPEAEPTIADIKRVLNEIKDKNITTIFFENFINSKTIKSIARDKNINIDVFQPLGNITADEAHKNLTYKSIMQNNLDKLSKALLCK